MAAGVGILALYNHFPPYVVQQADLEAEDGVPGKYTIGLGQEELCFGSDREDPVSMALTAAVRLVEQYGVSTSEIGRIEVGSEGGVDRSKSIKSYLCQHFATQGNTSIEGADSMHGCYGGTAALLNSVNWCESRSWDGRLALVVASDVAIYAPGSAARPTGGCGAVAMLIGPNAPLQLLPPPWRATHSIHCFDFFKPHSSPLYPVVDGPLTTTTFLAAIDACAALLHARLLAAGKLGEAGALLPLFTAFVSHAPFNKIVRKAFSRLVLQDMLRASRAGTPLDHSAQHTACTIAAACGAPQAGGSATGPTAPSTVALNGPSTSSSAAAAPPSSSAAAAAAAEAAAAAAAAVRAGPTSTSSDIVESHAQPSLPMGDAPAGIAAAAAAGTSRMAQLQLGTQAAAQPGASAPVLPAVPPAVSPSVLSVSALGLDPDMLPDSSRCDKALDRALLVASEQAYQQQVADSAWLQRRCGNQYTASLYGGLAALLERRSTTSLLGHKLLLFAFGSGAVASLLVLEVGAGAGRFTLEAMASKARLAKRVPASPADYAAASEAYTQAYSQAPYRPIGSIADLGPRIAYLDRVDERHRRWYKWTSQ